MWALAAQIRDSNSFISAPKDQGKLLLTKDDMKMLLDIIRKGVEYEHSGETLLALANLVHEEGIIFFFQTF